MFPVQISYQSIESSDPGINVPGPRRTVSKLKNETYHMFSNLHPGTTYLISVRARTAKGFGQTALTEITTNISGNEGSGGAALESSREEKREELPGGSASRLSPTNVLYLEPGFFFSLPFSLLTSASFFCLCSLVRAPPESKSYFRFVFPLATLNPVTHCHLSVPETQIKSLGSRQTPERA